MTTMQTVNSPFFYLLLSLHTVIATIVYLYFSPEDQDQLGDLLTSLFDDSSQGNTLPEPVVPESWNHHQLTVELSNALKQLMVS